MIIDISNKGFKRIFNDKRFELPIRWDGEVYVNSLKELYDSYFKSLCKNSIDDRCKLLAETNNEGDFGNNCVDENCIASDIKLICENLIETLIDMIRGCLQRLMKLLTK